MQTTPHFKNYLRGIETVKKRLIVKLKKGNYENFGQKEYRDFKDMVNLNSEIPFHEKAELCDRFSSMINEIQ